MILVLVSNNFDKRVCVCYSILTFFLHVLEFAPGCWCDGLTMFNQPQEYPLLTGEATKTLWKPSRSHARLVHFDGTPQLLWMPDAFSKGREDNSSWGLDMFDGFDGFNVWMWSIWKKVARCILRIGKGGHCVCSLQYMYAYLYIYVVQL